MPPPADRMRLLRQPLHASACASHLSDGLARGSSAASSSETESEPVDKKLQDVPVASYQYRHEAEIAAGFLELSSAPRKAPSTSLITGHA